MSSLSREDVPVPVRLAKLQPAASALFSSCRGNVEPSVSLGGTHLHETAAVLTACTALTVKFIFTSCFWSLLTCHISTH